MNNRRKFLKLGTSLSLGAFLPFQYCSSAEKNKTVKINLKEAVDGTLERIGIQLYSVKEDMAKDPKGTIEKLAQFGYNQLEGFDGGQGIFWGMNNTDFKAFTDDLGLDYAASHANVFENLEQTAEQAGEIGMKYLICPYAGEQSSVEKYKELAVKFNQAGEVCRNNGLRFAYHNHGYTFKEVEGQIPQDILLKETDPELVDFELDIYWAVTAGADPNEYFEKYKNRFRLCHVKDREKSAPPEETDASIVLGEGSIDFREILRTAKESGMEYFIVEQEKFDGLSPLEAAEKNATYLNKLVF
ncbi:sugar phosphate isomerase/epimerase [Echinicola jeungdonensis]|uniref:Sugar phosphate isomerase/epimerase family protein n=1 Tax=Echinicola jeungdonensis TaxID=709343 RepID=A0ABV5J3H0_9BACT|nr:sugar phosphate isomerase/epimerase [Echinicola jeungdonensis]MDN3669625.1 sugar phosphate isomerase/epimerase [Echinicola jeungdonensis]